MIYKAIAAALIVFELTKLARLYYLKTRGVKSLKVFKEYVQKETIKLAYKTTDGTKVYAYDNPFQMPANRAISAEVATVQASMNIDSKSLRIMLQSVKGHFNKGDAVKGCQIIENILERMKYACEEITLTNLANCYLVLEGENPEIIDDKFNKKKKEIMDSDPLAKGFFLEYALKVTQDFGKVSGQDILNYLEAQKQEVPLETK